MTAFSYPHGAVAHSVSPRPDASLFERHCHNGYELLFVLRGEGDYIVEGTLYPLRGGTLMNEGIKPGNRTLELFPWQRGSCLPA